MGRISLPSISKLEDVLDLLLNPEKYKQYLLEFKNAHDAATLALANLETKAQADTYLSQSITAHQHAEKARADAHKVLADAKYEADKMCEKMLAHADEINNRIVVEQKTLLSQMQEFKKAKAEFDSYKAASEEQIASQKRQNDQVRSELEKLSAKLEDKRVKISLAAEALR